MLRLALAAAVAAVLFVAPAAAQSPILAEGDLSRLAAVYDKAKRGETITIVGLGGSITAGESASAPDRRWLNRAASWLSETFNARVNLINAGIGGTNSAFGALRFERDVAAHRPDLVLIDYAVNNAPDDIASYESVLRKALGDGRAVIAIMFSNGLGESQQEGLAAVAAHYGVPAVSYRDPIAAMVAEGKLRWTDVTAPDRVHPVDLGHQYAAQFVRALFEHAKAKFDRAPEARAIQPLPAPLHDTVMERTGFLSGSALLTPQRKGFILAPPLAAMVSDTYDGRGGHVGDWFEVAITVGAPGTIWLALHERPAGSGTAVIALDGVMVHAHDTNNAALWPGGAARVITVAQGVSPGRHVLRVFNAPNAAKIERPKLWIYGIGYTAP